jgi:hypothetical protein
MTIKTYNLLMSLLETEYNHSSYSVTDSSYRHQLQKAMEELDEIIEPEPKENLMAEAFPELQKNVDGLMNLSIRK